MPTKKTTRSKPKTTTVKLKTAMSSMVPFDVEIDGEFVPRNSASDGATVKLDSAAADRMIAKGRAEAV